jgi:hypothetical protein
MKTRSQLIDQAELILEDSTNIIFSSNLLSSLLDDALVEVSLYYPNTVNHWLTARNKSKDIDINSISNFSKANYAVYPVDILDADGEIQDDSNLDINRRNVISEFDFIRLSVKEAPTAKKSGTLTGTVTSTADSTAVSGVGSAFTTELRAGYYLKIGSEWVRISSITSNTALVLSSYAASSETITDYWRSDVIVNCDKKHYATTQTDLIGAIDSGVAGGYAEGVWSINVDALGTGQIDGGTFFRIEGTDGIYMVTKDATITSNEATLYIEPRLADRAIENAVVTFYATSLNPQVEYVIPDLIAGHAALNWIGEGRTMILSSIAHVTASDTPIETVASRLTQAVSDLASGRAYVNSVPVYSDPSALYQGFSNREVSSAVGYLNQAQGYRANASHELSIASALIRYEQWGKDKISYALASLKRIAPCKMFKMYSDK